MRAFHDRPAQHPRRAYPLLSGITSASAVLAALGVLLLTLAGCVPAGHIPAAGIGGPLTRVVRRDRAVIVADTTRTPLQKRVDLRDGELLLLNATAAGYDTAGVPE